VPYAAKLMFAAALKAADRALAIPRAEIAGLIVIAPALFVLVPAYGLFGAAAATVLAQAASASVLGARTRARAGAPAAAADAADARRTSRCCAAYLDRALNRA
jgi:O-antigen/teichoic acid export membrane protein